MIYLVTLARTIVKHAELNINMLKKCVNVVNLYIKSEKIYSIGSIKCNEIFKTCHSSTVESKQAGYFEYSVEIGIFRLSH